MHCKKINDKTWSRFPDFYQFFKKKSQQLSNLLEFRYSFFLLHNANILIFCQ